MKKTIVIILLSFSIFLVSCAPRNRCRNSRTIETPNSIYVRTVPGWPDKGRPTATFKNGITVVAKRNGSGIDVKCPKGQVLLVQRLIAAGTIVGKKCNLKQGCLISGVQFILTGGNASFTAYNKVIQAGVTIEDENAWILGPNNGLSSVNCIPSDDVNNWINT
ncbi:hypothetical protein [Francisella sp. SYW-9]|uniref:hypothetical protein n=1 Tax=Francisella sp. SYW-9 TaxID=2610888 RepID=UPI00123E350F|nr:hypothetical protein [Francisella sp. SYW-9]